MGRESSIDLIDEINVNGCERRARCKFFHCTIDNCSFCTSNVERYVEHLTKGHKVTEVKCHFCFLISGVRKLHSIEQLKDHYRLVHSGADYQCSVCVYRSNDMGFVHLHQKFAHKDKKKVELQVFKCQSVYNLNSISNIERIYQNKDSKIWHCKVCPYTNGNRNKVREHFAINHGHMTFIAKQVEDKKVGTARTENNGKMNVQKEKDASLKKSVVNGLAKSTPINQQPKQTVVNSLPTSSTINPQPKQTVVNSLATSSIINQQPKQTVVNSLATSSPINQQSNHPYNGHINRKRKIVHTGLVVSQLGSKASDMYEHFCTLCQQGIHGKLETHLKNNHNCDSSFKCKFCGIIGSKGTLIEHGKSLHSNADVSEKFIVPYQRGMEGEKVKKPVDKIPNLKKAKKSTGGSIKEKIQANNHLGPTSWNEKSTNGNKNETVTNGNAKPKTSNGTVIELASNKQYDIMGQFNDVARKSDIYFCFLCQNFVNDFEMALTHMKTHIEFGYHCSKCDYYNVNKEMVEFHINENHRYQTAIITNDEFTRRGTLNWMIEFLNKQFIKAKLTRISDDDDDDDDEMEMSKVQLDCFLCKRAAQADSQMRDNKYETITQHSNHLIAHSCWFKYDCTICGESLKKSDFTNHLKKHPNKCTDIFEERKDAKVESYLNNQFGYISSLYMDQLKKVHKIKESSVALNKLSDIVIRTWTRENRCNQQIEELTLSDDEDEDDRSKINSFKRKSDETTIEENKSNASTSVENGWDKSSTSYEENRKKAKIARRVSFSEHNQIRSFDKNFPPMEISNCA